MSSGPSDTGSRGIDRAATGADERPPAHGTARHAARDTEADACWAALVEAASAPYRASGRFAWHWARGKLGRDPAFRQMLQQGLIAPGSRVLDIGCGQGLLASLLHVAGQQARQGAWPTGWGDAPLDVQVAGIELIDGEVHRAREAMLRLGVAAEFTAGDMRHTPFPEADVVVILDVLHYVRIEEQDAVLQRVHQALPVGGLLLLRVGDAATRARFRLTQWIDAVVSLMRWGRVAPLHGRELAQWTAHLQTLGFTVRAQPMSQGTPFANVLLVCQKTAQKVAQTISPTAFED